MVSTYCWPKMRRASYVIWNELELLRFDDSTLVPHHRPPESENMISQETRLIPLSPFASQQAIKADETRQLCDARHLDVTNLTTQRLQCQVTLWERNKFNLFHNTRGTTFSKDTPTIRFSRSNCNKLRCRESRLQICDACEHDSATLVDGYAQNEL